MFTFLTVLRWISVLSKLVFVISVIAKMVVSLSTVSMCIWSEPIDIKLIRMLVTRLQIRYRSGK
ncbi:hypothetical protein D3C85_1744670 [compost metagenome]